MSYPGGKAGSGVYQLLINQMPPHEEYVEPFLGGGAVMRAKWPAVVNIGLDLDGEVVHRAAALAGRGEWISGPGLVAVPDVARARFVFHQADGIAYLAAREWTGRELVYCDPPYLMSTRSSRRRIYRCELEAVDHRRLLRVCRRLPCRVMVSGYWSLMYALVLSSWRLVRYRTMTRGGRMAEECLWCNFPEPVELHDYRYLGQGFRERERITRQQRRWRVRLEAMPRLQRQALLSVLRAMGTGA
jgi:hypothetical protein